MSSIQSVFALFDKEYKTTHAGSQNRIKAFIIALSIREILIPDSHKQTWRFPDPGDLPLAYLSALVSFISSFRLLHFGRLTVFFLEHDESANFAQTG